MKLLARLIPVVGVLALIAAGVLYFVPEARDRLDFDDDDAAGAGPDVWDPKVLPLVEFVEEERDLEFRHPVYVDFLPPKEFEEELADGGEQELTDEDREEIDDTVAFFRALDLVAKDVDLFKQVERLTQAGVVGFYSPEDERIRVRGAELTPSTRATLVHELTHALQDQQFDIGEVQERLDESDDAGSGAYDALVEGDASRVETAYKESLSEKDSAELERIAAAEAAEFRKRSKGIPPILLTIIGAPYALGESMLDLAVAVDGKGAVDRLFATPPTTDEHLLDPWTLLEDEDAGTEVDVDVPEVGTGEEELDSGDFGALGWYLVLGQRLDGRTVLAATDGWGGDAYSTFERDGRSCVRVAYQGDTRRDVDQMEAALDRWIDASPVTARVERADGGLLFTSCASKAGPGPDQDAKLDLPLVRTTITAQVVESGADPEFARCYAGKVIDAFTVEQLSGNDPDVIAQAQQLALRCR